MPTVKRYEPATARTGHPFDNIPDLPCRTTLNPDVFFPENGKASATAEAICARCPIETECLAWALETGQAFGVWGGMSATDRSRMTLTERLTVFRDARPFHTLTDSAETA